MGETVRLTSAVDGFRYEAWRSPVSDARRGGLVICPAIWGVTPHLRALAAEYAETGYETLVPSLFDRFRPGFPEVDIDPARLDEQMGYGAATRWGLDVLDAVQAAVDRLAPPVFVLGFCFGGTVAWLASARCGGIAAVACYYGGHIRAHIGETPRVPVIMHFGRVDPLIPLADVEAIREAHPDLPVHLYDAGHAFAAPSDYAPEAARLAYLRTLAHFTRNSGVRTES